MDGEEGATATALQRNHAPGGAVACSPRHVQTETDCNYNLHSTGDNALTWSVDSNHDNSDYQWFLDYGYRENSNHHQSILSLSSPRDLCYYNDLSKNLDANLAHVDMDDFHSEILSTLPNMCCDLQGIEEREMFASVSGSMMVKFDFDSSMSPHTSSQETANSISVCKSELLFSPVRDSYLPSANLSVDSLDLSEADMQLMVTCQANKNNYTIAFEGSTHIACQDSECGESSDVTSDESLTTRCRQAEQPQPGLKQEAAMTRSDGMFTTWSKLKQRSSEHLQLRRHGSGNNNTTQTMDTQPAVATEQSKSMSLPNLFRHRHRAALGLSMSSRLSSEMGSSVDSDPHCVKLYDIQKSNASDSSADSGAREAKTDSGHNFNLVKLFMKQKSSSNDMMSMEQSSECCESCGEGRATWTKLHPNYSSLRGLESNTGNPGRVRTQEKETSDSESVEQITESSKQASESVEQISETCNDVSTRSDMSTHRHNFNVNNNNSLMTKDVYGTDESTQENGSNTESAENVPCTCRKVRDRPQRAMERSIQTSRLAELPEPAHSTKVPVYVLYPNYALPSLDFLKENHYVQNIDLSKVFLRPQSYETSREGREPREARSKRPFSVNDIESLKRTGFKHVRDWDSLTFLLPTQYKQFLQEIPEIVAQLKDLKAVKADLKPLFCLSPPPTRAKRRPVSCDCSSDVSQPSSGFRGSSTMMASNTTPPPSAPMRGTSLKTPDEAPPRPPLPKGILRNHSLDNTKYTCKTQKENANKRYSMIELDGKSRGGALVDPYYLKSPTRKLDEYELRSKKLKYSRNMEVCDKPKASDVSSLENDMRRLEELLEISAVFGDNVESFSETDMLKLRTQVSKFLTMQKNLERVSETLKNTETYDVDRHDWFDEAQTPHNTPEHRKRRSVETADDEMLRSLKKTVSFAQAQTVGVQGGKPKGATPPNSPNVSSVLAKPYHGKVKRSVDGPICEESTEGEASARKTLQPTAHLLYKRDLVMDVRQAVQSIEQAAGSGDQDQEAVAALCLQHLCPSLYAVLSDGLLEHRHTQFGPIRNSVWGVVEASSHQGPLTETLSELVLRLNRDEVLAEGLVKFNAFIFGLLNVRAVDGWVSYLRTRDDLLHRYYEPNGLLPLSNTAGAPIRVLVDQLVGILKPLAQLDLRLDLLYQAKLLHRSLLNINTLLETKNEETSQLLTPTKQMMLLKLVQSIHNSISQCGKEDTIDQLLENTGARPAHGGGAKPRPRSGCETPLQGEPVCDVSSVMKKRWSGVQFNSKLLKAFERLGEDTESEYTDSLDNPRLKGTPTPASPTKTGNKRLESSDDTSIGSRDLSDRSPVHASQEHRRSVLSNLNKRLDKTDCGGGKFKRLQQRWEMLSGRSASNTSSGANSPSQGSPTHSAKPPTSRQPSLPSMPATHTPHTAHTAHTTSPTTRVSKIPRPVTSPVRPSTAPSPLTQPHGGGGRKVPSPTTALPKPRMPVAGSRGSNRLSRCDEGGAPGPAGLKRDAVRPTSLPYRPPGTNTVPARRHQPTRASSMSVNRTDTVKTVRTVQHRLGSDSGHLTFNEGDKLRVVLEVDDTWLLCCKGTNKGLVPKAAVIPLPDQSRF